jgi:hypothetical protein
MNEPEPTRRPPEGQALARRAFFEELDGKLSAAGYAVRAPVAMGGTPTPPVAAPPPPALSFEAWAELSIRFADAAPEDLAAALSARGLTPEVWERLDRAYLRALCDDMRAGKQELQPLYEAKRREEAARRAGVRAEGTPPAPTPEPAPGAGTAGSPDLAAPIWEAMGRMPFVPPAPETPAKGKRPAKTVPSKVAPSSVGGETMGLDPAQQRATPTLPFVGSNGGSAMGYVPRLSARQYVALSAELALQPAPREATMRRYQVPTEAALRALEEEWRHPARRAELEAAMAEFAVVLRVRALG